MAHRPLEAEPMAFWGDLRIRTRIAISQITRMGIIINTKAFKGVAPKRCAACGTPGGIRVSSRFSSNFFVQKYHRIYSNNTHKSAMRDNMSPNPLLDARLRAAMINAAAIARSLLIIVWLIYGALPPAAIDALADS